MPGQLDQISRVIGNIESKIDEIEVRTTEDRAIGNRRHAENQEAIGKLSAKLESHAIALAIQPSVWMSKRRLTGLASIGIAVLGGAGLVAETMIKWFVNWALSHFHG